MKFNFCKNKETGNFFAADIKTLRGMAREFKPRTFREYDADSNGGAITHNEWTLEECLSLIDGTDTVTFGTVFGEF